MLTLAMILLPSLSPPPPATDRVTEPWIAREEAKFVDPDAVALDRFATSVSLSGDTALIGVPNDDDGSDDSGSAHVFVRSGSSWSRQAKIHAGDAARADLFGWAVAISGDLAVIGAPRTDEPGIDAGSAYAFVRTGTTWTEEAELIPIQGGNASHFGEAVDLSGTTLVVGASQDGSVFPIYGAAYVYERTGTGWVQQGKLNAIAFGGHTQLFGNSVSVSGDTVVVGCIQHGLDYDDLPGAAFVFVRSGTRWTPQARLMASDAADGDQFGRSVRVEGDTVVVGANADCDGADRTGSAYVFTRTGTSWSQTAKLTASDPTMGAQFGFAIDLEGDNLLITAKGGSAATPSLGAAYLFRRSGMSWSESVHFAAHDAHWGMEFGFTGSLDGNRALIGAYHASDAGVWSGSAYVFALEPAPDASCQWYCGSGVNLDTFTVLAPFTLGGTFQGSVTYGPPYVGATLAAYLGRLTFSLWSQEVLIDPTQPEILGMPTRFGSGAALFTWSIPLEPTYAGYRIYPQAAILGGCSIRLTCAYDCTVGY
jgi:hypothetical protein